MNNIIISGHLCADPDLKQTPKGMSVVSAKIAVKRPFAKDQTDFFLCVFWRQQAEYLAKYAHKGDVVGVAGYLTVREWDDNNGNKRSVTEIVCTNVEIMRQQLRQQEAQAAPYFSTSDSKAKAAAVMDEVYVPGDDELPF